MNEDSNEKGDLAALVRLLAAEFHDQGVPEFVPREGRFPAVKGKAHVAIGMRRTGKTYFLFQRINEILTGDVPIRRVLYLNFEDDRLPDLTGRDLGAMVDAYYASYPDNHDHLCYFFFDEIQNVKDWAPAVRRLLDTKKAEIYLSGSSSKILSKEIATSLRGRALATEVWPFSWTEYLAAKKIAKPGPVLSPKARDTYLKHFKDYLLGGGLPEIVGLDDHEVARRILQDYVHTVTYRDIVERHGVTNLSLLRQLIKTVLKNAAGRFSVNRCYRDFKSQGLAVGKNTVHDYMEHLKDAYLAFDVPLFTESVRRQNSNPRKLYAIDTGLVLANTFHFSDNLGALFENLVYLNLRRRSSEIHYYLTGEGQEVDFVVADVAGKLNLIQACWNADDHVTRAREESALKAGSRELKVKGRIVTPLDCISGNV